MQAAAAEVLSKDYQLGWIGSAYQELQAGGTGQLAFVFGIVMVFLILAAQYERWMLPLAVVTAVPFAVFGAIFAIWRSEEHTSELQSLMRISYAVFCLKKKN